MEEKEGVEGMDECCVGVFVDYDEDVKGGVACSPWSSSESGLPLHNANVVCVCVRGQERRKCFRHRIERGESEWVVFGGNLSGCVSLRMQWYEWYDMRYGMYVSGRRICRHEHERKKERRCTEADNRRMVEGVRRVSGQKSEEQDQEEKEEARCKKIPTKKKSMKRHTEKKALKQRHLFLSRRDVFCLGLSSNTTPT